MRILVTGGAGFIGSHLITRLMQEGHEVVCLDNLFTGSKGNLAPWLEHPNFTFVHHDITEPLDLEVDQIYHLACPASPPHYQADPIKTAKIGFLGTLHVLELAQKTGARLLIASTSEVYGDPEVHPQSEDYWGYVNCTGIRACYDEGKRIGETLAFDFHRRYGTAIRIARIFNTYGPTMNFEDGRVVSNLVIQALKGLPLTIYGEGNQTRSFCYVSDLVEGLYRLMQGEHIGPINLGNPSEFTILELANLVKELIPTTSEFTYRPLPSDDPKQRRPDITRAKTLLGWEPKIPLREGLLKMIEDFQQRMG
jgi:UDP-glucuronate decarboxylase